MSALSEQHIRSTQQLHKLLAIPTSESADHVQGLNFSFYFVSTAVAGLATFGVYFLTVGPLTATKVGSVLDSVDSLTPTSCHDRS